MTVAIVGGTGAEGFGLALRLARAGERVVIGSRSAERGEEAARRAAEILSGITEAGVHVDGAANDDAVASAGVTLLTVPFAGQAEICRSVRGALRPGAVVCDCTSPLATAVGGRPWQVLRPWHGSAAEQARAILGKGVRVVSGFHTISEEVLADLERPLVGDVLLTGDDAEAKAQVGALAEKMPNLRWIDAGALSMSRVTETLTAVLVSVNRAYKMRTAGFSLTGRDAWGSPPTR